MPKFPCSVPGRAQQGLGTRLFVHVQPGGIRELVHSQTALLSLAQCPLCLLPAALEGTQASWQQIPSRQPQGGEGLGHTGGHCCLAPGLGGPGGRRRTNQAPHGTLAAGTCWCSPCPGLGPTPQHVWAQSHSYPQFPDLSSAYSKASGPALFLPTIPQAWPCSHPEPPGLQSCSKPGRIPQAWPRSYPQSPGALPCYALPQGPWGSQPYSVIPRGQCYQACYPESPKP